jgi:hypothetical protein
MDFQSAPTRPRSAFTETSIHAPAPFDSILTRRPRCPGCDHPAIAPVASTYRRDGLVENDWVCSSCGFEWSSGFNGLFA